MLDHSGFKAQTTDEESTLTDTERKGTGIYRVVDLLKQGIGECDFRLVENKKYSIGHFFLFTSINSSKAMVISGDRRMGVNVVHANTLVNIICTN